jgi:hypothetical protein
MNMKVAVYDAGGKYIGYITTKDEQYQEMREEQENCPIVDSNETDKAKQILQIQQNIICRIDSLKQLLIKLQSDMQAYSPRAAIQVRHLIYRIDDDTQEGIKNRWLLDTRSMISKVLISTKND